MDLRVKQVLPSLKSVTATSEDIHFNLSFDESTKSIIPSTIQETLSLNEQFNTERQISDKYRIVIQPEIISSVIGLKKDYTSTSSLFDGLTTDDIDSDFFHLNELFDFHIICPETLYYNSTDDTYDLFGKPILLNDNIELIKSGFYKNLFFEQQYQLITNNIIDLTDKIIVSDNNRIILPVTKLYLMTTLKSGSFNYYKELYDTTTKTTYISGGVLSSNELNNNLYLGNFSFNINTYEFTSNKEPQYRIDVSFTDKMMRYVYNPFSEIVVREFSEYIEGGNTKTTDNIPYYAYIINDDTNNNIANKNETYIINNTNFYSGTTRLSITDPIAMSPRKLIYNINSKFFEYYLDNLLYDKNYFKFYVNNTLLNENEHYIISEFNKDKIILRFTPNLSDIFSFNYLNGENYIWRDLLDKGFIDSTTGTGVNYPFLNGVNYIFSNIKKTIKPDRNDLVTNDFYCKYTFTTSEDIVKSNNDFLSDKCN